TGNRQVAGAGRDDYHSSGNRRRFVGRQPERSRDPVLLRLGKPACQVLGLLVVETSRQTILAGFIQVADKAFDPFAALAFAEDHFWKSAAAEPMQVKGGKTELGNSGGVEAKKGGLDVQATGTDFLQNVTQ